MPFSELKGIFKSKSKSPKPIRPSPIFLVFRLMSSMGLRGKALISRALSKKLTPVLTAFANAFQSTDFLSRLSVLMNDHTFMEPRLHDSSGYSKSSPHGFVVAIGPRVFKKGLYSLMRS